MLLFLRPDIIKNICELDAIAQYFLYSGKDAICVSWTKMWLIRYGAT